MVAPDVWTLKVLKPGKNGLVLATGVCCACTYGIRPAATPTAAIAACLKRSRLPGMNSEVFAMIQFPRYEFETGWCCTRRFRSNTFD